jgi:glycosyltransferase involved in cell wall biosynthesis
MRVLFLHNNFPAQYRHVAAALAADPANEVVFATQRSDGELPRVRKLLYKPARLPRKETHHYLQSFEGAVLNGQAMFRLCEKLRADGFVPDVICGHSGWGPTLYVREIFPRARLVVYFEWYYRPHGSDADFLKHGAIDADTACKIRTRNGPILLDLAECDVGVCPTHFQRDQFPEVFHRKLTVLHDGIDTEFFRPESGAKLTLPDLDLTGASEIVTYVARGMEPYRGFPEFMRAAALLTRQRPNLHIVVVGADRVAYGAQLPEGQSYKQNLLSELADCDLSRLHFAGLLPYGAYRQVLRASSAHVYLTVPFVLSWSLLEAMSTGCLVVASDTAPVREVITDGRNGLLVDFFSPEAIAARVAEALDRPSWSAQMGEAARATILDRYDLRRLLPKQLALLQLPATDAVLSADTAAAPEA